MDAGRIVEVINLACLLQVLYDIYFGMFSFVLILVTSNMGLSKPYLDYSCPLQQSLMGHDLSY